MYISIINLHFLLIMDVFLLQYAETVLVFKLFKQAHVNTYVMVNLKET